MHQTDDSFILLGLGANLPSRFGTPRQTLLAALDHLEQRGVTLRALSRFWETAPVPLSDQPWYVNAVAAVDTDLDPLELLTLLHAVEDDFGRVRTVVNAPRLIDLDLLAYGRQQIRAGLVVPHPRLHERAFVLRPLADIAPGWTHPVSGQGLAALLALIPPEQDARPLAEPDDRADA